MPALVPRSEKIYAFLINLYPRAFRTEARSELLKVFRDLHREATVDTGAAALFRFWWYTLQDLAFSLSSEWKSILLDRRKSMRSQDPLGSTRPPKRKLRFVDIIRDLRIGARGLLRSPGYAITTVAVIGLGIGANTTIFSVADTLFLEDPTYLNEPDRLVRVTRTTERSRVGSLGYPDYRHFMEQNATLDGLAAYDPNGITLAFGVEDQRATVHGWFVSGNYFEVLGLLPATGRWFSVEEDQTPGTHPVVVISHGLWKRAFGADPAAVGASIVLNGKTFQVIGVAPEGFRGISPIEGVPDLWIPLNMLLLLSPDTCLCALERVSGESWFWLSSVGRLKSGVSVEMADAELGSMARDLVETYSAWNEGIGAAVHQGYKIAPARRSALGSMTRLLFVTAFFVLFIAGANLAILMLARASVRRQDIGLRIALGAGRRQVIWHSLVETLLICLMGGVVGLSLTFGGGQLASEVFPGTLNETIRPDGTVLIFAIAVSLGVALTVGVMPALNASRIDVRNSFVEGGGRSARSRLRNVLVVSQVGLSLVLVSGAALFTRSLLNARAVDLGFGLEDRVVVSVNLANHGYETETGQEFIRRAVSEMEAVPGVQAVGTTVMVPFRGSWGRSVLPEGYEDTDDNRVAIGVNAVSPGYFEAMGIPVSEGRVFRFDDDRSSMPVVVVNETFADQVWPGESAIGKRLNRSDAALTVIGVVRNATYYDLGEEPQVQVYYPILQDYQPGVRFLLHGSGDVLALGQAAQGILHSLDPAIAVAGSQTLEDTFQQEIGRYRSAATMVGLLSGLALFLTVTGLYGVLSYLVVQRTRDIGIRIALGATQGQVRTSILRTGVGLAGIGILIGLLGAAGLSRFVTSFLYGIEALDPMTFVLVPLLLVGVAVVASLLPAHRAMSIDPMEALRADD